MDVKIRSNQVCCVLGGTVLGVRGGAPAVEAFFFKKYYHYYLLIYFLVLMTQITTTVWSLT